MGKELLELQLKEAVLRAETLCAILETTAADPRIPADMRAALNEALKVVQ